MSDGWDIKALREHIEAIGDAEGELLTLVRSCDRYNLIYQYHLYTARDAMEGIVKEGDSSAFQNTRYVFGVAENQEEYHHAMIANEANLFGAIYATRATIDIFSQLVNSLVLGGKIRTSECNVHFVSQSLCKSELKSRLVALLDESWFKYVSDFVNTIKHRRLMRHTFKVHFDRPGTSIAIDGFEYKDRVHPSYSDSDILKGTIEVNRSIVDCGKALNAVVLVTAE